MSRCLLGFFFHMHCFVALLISSSSLVRNTAPSRILYSVDWPLAANEDGATFIASMRNSGLVTSGEFA
ncbi:amidohydrolase 2 [Apiospora arundinis]|uniref:Amidohydrolase 2 n=1 Tax=Apiospora arundinis TaxID=335852 RepID=A0ABR2HJK7_9PEZI